METIRAKKSLGQNFLIDTDILSIISNATEIAEKNIIEVWPWYGALTEYIKIQNPLHLDLVELDNDMIRILKKEYGTEKKFTIHHQDILSFIPSHRPYKVIANIPYYITSPILFRFLYDLEEKPNTMVILMQKEVGEKILAKKWKKNQYSALSLAMYLACEDISLVTFVPKEAFSPSPKVDSVVLRFELRKNRDEQEETALLDIWRQAFRTPRKTLKKNLQWSRYELLCSWSFLQDIGYSESVRAEAIDFWDWKRILKKFPIFCESLQ